MKLLRKNPIYGSAIFLEDVFVRPSVEPLKMRIMHGFAYRAWMVLLDYFNRDARRAHGQFQPRVTGLVTTYELLPEYGVTRSGKRYSTNHLDSMMNEFELMQFFDKHVGSKMNIPSAVEWKDPAVLNRAAYSLMFLLNLLRSTDSRLDAAGAIREESWGRSIILLHPMQELQLITGLLWPDKILLETPTEIANVEKLMEMKGRLKNLDWFNEDSSNLPSLWRSTLIGHARRNLRNDPGNPFQKPMSEAIPAEVYRYLTQTFLSCEDALLMRSDIEDAVTLRVLGELNAKVSLVEPRIYSGSAMETYRGFMATRSTAHKSLKSNLSTLGLKTVRSWFQGQKDSQLVDQVIKDLEAHQEWRNDKAQLKHVQIMPVDSILSHMEWPFASFSREKYDATTGVSTKVSHTIYTKGPVLVLKDKFISDQAKCATLDEVGDQNTTFTVFVRDVRGEAHFWDNKLVDTLRDLCLRALSDQLMEYQFHYENSLSELDDVKKDEVRKLLGRIRHLTNYCVEVPVTLLSSMATYVDPDGVLMTIRPVDSQPLGGDYLDVDGHFAVFDTVKPANYCAVVDYHWEYLFSLNQQAVPMIIDPVRPLEQLLACKAKLLVVEPQDVESQLYLFGIPGLNFYGRKAMTSREDATQVTFPNLRWAVQVVRVVNACFEPDVFEQIKPSFKDTVRNWLARLPAHTSRVGRHYPGPLIEALSKLAHVDSRHVYYRSMVGREDVLEILGKWVPTYLFGDLFGELLAEATVPFSSYGSNVNLVSTHDSALEPDGQVKEFRLHVKEFLMEHVLDPKLIIPNASSKS